MEVWREATLNMPQSCLNDKYCIMFCLCSIWNYAVRVIETRMLLHLFLIIIVTIEISKY